MLRTAEELHRAAYRKVLESYDFNPGTPDAHFIESQLAETAGETIGKPLGAQVLKLIDETHRLEAAETAPNAAVLHVLALYVRCVLSDGAQGVLTLTLAIKEISDWVGPEPTAEADREERAKRVDRLRTAADQLKLLTEMAGQSRVERWREIVQLAHQMNEGDPIANSLIILGNLTLLDDLPIEDDDALPLTRDSSARARFLAGMDPGSHYETWVAVFLRREGKLCNDLGRPDEASRAFARADEIIDRYPTADPDLIY